MSELSATVTDCELASETAPAASVEHLRQENSRLKRHVVELERRLRKRDEQRRAMLHIMGELNTSNKRLADQRKSMIHILGDYENDRRRLAQQKERLDNSRRALLHILQDVHQTNIRLGDSRKAMIHIMGDLRDTTEEIQRREAELRDNKLTPDRYNSPMHSFRNYLSAPYSDYRCLPFLHGR